MTVPPALVNGLVAAVTLAALTLALVGLRAWRRTRRARFLLVTLAFGVLFVRGVAVTLGLFLEQPWQDLFAWGAAADALLVFLLYLALVR